MLINTLEINLINFGIFVLIWLFFLMFIAYATYRRDGILEGLTFFAGIMALLVFVIGISLIFNGVMYG